MVALVKSLLTNTSRVQCRQSASRSLTHYSERQSNCVQVNSSSFEERQQQKDKHELVSTSLMMSSGGFLPMQDRVFSDSQEVRVPAAAESSMSSVSANSEPHVPPDSPGSSVSARLQDDYNELLKYAIVVPSYPHLPSLSLGRTPTTTTYQQPAASQPLQSVASIVAGGGQPMAMSGSHATQSGSQPVQTVPSTAASVHPRPMPVNLIDTSQPSDQDSTMNQDEEEDSAQFYTQQQQPPVKQPTDRYPGERLFESNGRQTGAFGDDTVSAGRQFGAIGGGEMWTGQPFGTGNKLFAAGDQQQAMTGQPKSTWNPAVSDRVLLTGDHESEEMHDNSSTYSYTATIDQDVTRMENLLDQWTTDLKHNIMGEFSQSKIRLLEHHRQQMLLERQRHAGEGSRLQNDMDELRELLATYENSIQRKDKLISEFRAALQQHQNRLTLQRSFSEMKIKHNDARREAFATNLARRHYERTIQQKVWTAWHSLIEARWRQRVEKACQAKAQEVCIALTNDYETKLSSLNEALEVARYEVRRLHEERDRYEETMKKAFMRGVCALNLEAMTMFHEGTENQGAGQGQEEGRGRDGVDGGYEMGDDGGDFESHPVTMRQEFVYTSEPPGAPASRVVTAPMRPAGTQSSQFSGGQSRSSNPDVARSRSSGRGAKVLSAKITARSDAKRTTSVPVGAQTLAPPMTSVVVERHQPINKQTIGQATAAKYPQSQPVAVTPAVIQRKIAGQQQTSGFPVTNIQTVKVVD